MAEGLLARFQIRSRVIRREEYEKKNGTKGYAIRLAFEGGLVELFGRNAEGLMSQCPPVQEECLLSGALTPSSQQDFGRSLFSLDVESIGPISSRSKS